LPSKCQESDPKSGFFRDLLEALTSPVARRITRFSLNFASAQPPSDERGNGDLLLRFESRRL
jgi:hypothetical protein